MRDGRSAQRDHCAVVLEGMVHRLEGELMASVSDWNAYLNVLHELALIEDKLRIVQAENNPETRNLATYLLYAHFETYP